MIDPFGRNITYLRVSVTDRCNLRCDYCKPPEGVKLLRHEDILSFEEIVDVVRIAVEMGVTKVRITGGEPVVRRNVESLIVMLSAIDGIEDLAMTTNGTLLADHAPALAAAGLHRVNVSLDAMDPASYARITRGGDVRTALAGIDAAIAAGLTPVKLNCVILASSDEPDARAVADFAREKHIQVRFIPRMDFQAGRFSIVQGGTGGDCPRCNRLRLSSDGFVRPCLFSDLGFSVRQLGAAGALTRAVGQKPHSGRACTHNWMHGIGG